MPDDATQIRAVIERWAVAVHAGDLETVLADPTNRCAILITGCA
jgi:ketosteroid isomerase-like protein